MKVLVLGAGAVGIATAHYLAQDGHEVCVVDRQTGAGMEASAGNAGLVAPGSSFPWAAPGMRVRLFKTLLRGDPRLRVKLRFDTALVGWLRAWVRQCNSASFHINALRMNRLATYSLHCLQALRRSANIDYAHTGDGILHILRSDKELQAAMRRLPLYDELGMPYTVLDPQGCCAVDPALEFAWTRFAGGLYLPMDETGDCGRFTRALAEQLPSRGVTFRYETQIQALRAEGGAVTGVQTPLGVLEADRYVLALSSAPLLLRPLGLKLPLRNVVNYSITFPLLNAARAPRTGIIDLQSEISMIRLGDYVRVGGGAELGVLPRLRNDRIRRLVEHFNRLYPYAADLSRPQAWAGASLVTPDGPPLLGPTPLANLFLNVGHGAQGWTMACGAARVVSDLISGREPDIEVDGLSIARYGGKLRAH
jgi:D-amino-acid dehydrogenase